MSMWGPMPSEAVMRRNTWITFATGVLLLLLGFYFGGLAGRNWLPGAGAVCAAGLRWAILHREEKS